MKCYRCNKKVGIFASNCPACGANLKIRTTSDVNQSISATKTPINPNQKTLNTNVKLESVFSQYFQNEGKPVINMTPNQNKKAASAIIGIFIFAFWSE